MEKELLNQEVLAIIDIRQIQKFMIHSNSTEDTCGASEIMIHIIHDALNDAVRTIDEPLSDGEYDLDQDRVSGPIPYFYDKKIRMMLINNAAGNCLLLFRTGSLCQKIIRRISRYFLDHTYCLEIASCAVRKTDNMAEDLSHLYKKLNKVKADSSTVHPQRAFPVSMVERNTGEMVCALTSFGEPVSRSTLVRRAAAANLPACIDLREVHTDKGPDGRPYVAVFHIDGNNIGMSKSQVLYRAGSYEEGILMRRKFNLNITENYTAALEKTTRLIRERFFPDGIDDMEFLRYYQLLHQGGDDLNAVAAPHIALAFIETFIEEISKTYLWNENGLTLPFSVCAGLALVDPEMPFVSAFEIAEECCSNAKKTAKESKNLINGRSGSWMDFDIQYSDTQQNLDVTRKNRYVSRQGVHLLLRPYCFDACHAADPRYYLSCKALAEAIDRMNFPEAVPDYFANAYAEDYMRVEEAVSELEARGYPIREKMGNPFLSIEGTGYAHWYDAIELRYFIR